MLRVGYGCHLGKRLKGEDGLRVDRMVVGSDQLVVALLCDGHGGHEAAACVLNDLGGHVVQAACGDASAASLRSAVEIAFATCHASLTASVDMTSGTTVTLVIVNESRGELTCASVGDSFAVMYAAATPTDAPPNYERLSCNDRLDESPAERARVVAQGYSLGQARHSASGLPGGPLRAWPGGVACAKSVGDADCGAMIDARPEIRQQAWPVHGGVVVMASDGVWDALSFALAGKIVVDAPDPTKAAERLTRAALSARGLRDDTSCVVLIGVVPTTLEHDAAPAPFAEDALEDALTPPSVPRRMRRPPQLGESEASLPRGLRSPSTSPAKVRTPQRLVASVSSSVASLLKLPMGHASASDAAEHLHGGGERDGEAHAASPPGSFISKPRLGEHSVKGGNLFLAAAAELGVLAAAAQTVSSSQEAHAPSTPLTAAGGAAQADDKEFHVHEATSATGSPSSVSADLAALGNGRVLGGQLAQDACVHGGRLFTRRRVRPTRSWSLPDNLSEMALEASAAQQPQPCTSPSLLKRFSEAVSPSRLRRISEEQFGGGMGGGMGGGGRAWGADGSEPGIHVPPQGRLVGHAPSAPNLRRRQSIP